MADGTITVEVSTQAAQVELERLRAENAALKRDLQYARDGLTKGRTRMREDNERLAREAGDERHVCPLQLDVVERCVALYSNEGDTVFSPFMGIGSEGYQAIKMGRKFVGTELKGSYFHHAVKYLREAEMIGRDLFNGAAA